ncbi:Detected protein of confused Function [Hibiscus syriacus]|uniref:Calcyclin-binding protein n=1 Tax=Hibiscus syriacus TaxID=106335 RepID=A0A6A2XCN0_HIBSY|nr:Detected protein of confused Function [Hibiscus syriacus]
MAEDLAPDLEELRHLQSIAKRPRILSLISSEIRSLEKLQTSKEDGNSVALPTASQVPTPISTSVYVSLEGVEQEKIQTEFKPMSFDIKFHDVKGKNYRCAIPKLNKEIVPEKCKVLLLVKPTRVIIALFKASKGDWSDLYFKGDKLKPSLDKEHDPMAGIMDLMKNMYEEGDEEMKRTIAKAWTDARSGKAEDTLKGY